RNAHDGDQPRRMAWRVERAGQVVELDVAPRLLQEAGGSVARLEVYVGAPPERVLVRRGFADGLWSGIEQSWDMAATTV
ncbi:RIP metalloprotease RseP, partial [Aeromonas hydrophila]|nr:RIP metalloprotease RseP [Aeromonas hydrophila]